MASAVAFTEPHRHPADAANVRYARASDRPTNVAFINGPVALGIVVLFNHLCIGEARPFPATQIANKRLAKLDGFS